MLYKLILYRTRVFLLSILFIVASCSSEEGSSDNNIDDDQVQEKNNVLLIIADDLGLDATVGYNIGNQKPSMPTLQNLINTGIKFNNVWSNPVCTPTRGTILTGKYGYRTSVLKVDDVLSTSEVSIFKKLNDNTNYSSAFIGKWHLSGRPPDRNHPNNMGIEYYSGILGGGVQNYFNWTLSKNGQNSNVNQYITSFFTDDAISWINNQNNPWFLCLSYNTPHTPFHLAPTDLHSQGALPDDDISIEQNPLPYYFSMIEAMDSEIGRLIESIGSNVLNNTTIIFIGDNGTPNQVAQQYNPRRVKGTLYKGGINVPMIVSGNKVTRSNDSDDSLINTTDLYSTVAELCGIENSDVFDSKSFVDLFNSNSSSNSRDYIYSELGNNEYAIRNSTHKYIHFEDGTEALFNLSVNEFERPNLLMQNQLPLSSNDSQNKDALTNKLNQIRN